MTCIGSFGYARPHFAAFSKFQDQKGQKGRNSKSNLKIINVQLFLPKASVVTIFMIDMNSSHPILIGQPKNGNFKGQNLQNDSKNGKIICLIFHYLAVFVVRYLAFDTNGENIDVAVA